jgi:UDP-glucose 4-epimerase
MSKAENEGDGKIIVVTGGAGFIGSHLIEALLQQNPAHTIYSLDNYFTGKEENHIDGATYIRGHTKDIDSLITVRPDIVFHLGEYSRVEASFDDVSKVFDFNKVGTFAVLEFCRKHNCKMLYAGSSTKFADGGMGRDQGPYAWAKATNTELVSNYGNWFGLNYAITYFYNVYGGREIKDGKYATLIALFKEKFRKGDPLTVVAPGTQLRNFTHVDDIVRGLILVGEKGEGDGYGLGAEEAFTVKEIAEMFGGEIVMLPERKGNRMQSYVDVVRARNEFGWRAEKNIKEHIQEFVRELKKK